MKHNCNYCSNEIILETEGIKVEEKNKTYWLCKYCEHILLYNDSSFLVILSAMFHELEKTIKGNK